ncbi:uncharacterized protein BP01DRAFT_368269 [Aspergillus saccharolyticus JOP 1030-1]|uniref:Uncharacterized protein n=1 Tax=Aspergillus saccharolyticus JOP 1030-1 TaxID=1450539 RepID=A0A318Z590_9EURO|nr:hypothetical protein BP01DRAFT_368269 [Aspergillus saccharolyticus JOP 1030-1]PYH42229.1 hypothetical protein BP01DRAFT_368269 [Aspergillus saccharolyticus JOP 1030-1]
MDALERVQEYKSRLKALWLDPHVDQIIRAWGQLSPPTSPMRSRDGLPQNWRIYGLKIYYNTTTPGYVTWIGEDQLLYKHIDFSIGQFRGFIHRLAGTAQQILQDKLLFQ